MSSLVAQPLCKEGEGVDKAQSRREEEGVDKDLSEGTEVEGVVPAVSLRQATSTRVTPPAHCDRTLRPVCVYVCVEMTWRTPWRKIPSHMADAVEEDSLETVEEDTVAGVNDVAHAVEDDTPAHSLN